MFYSKIGLASFGLLSLLSSTPLVASEFLHAQADPIPPNCQLLREVTTGETEVTKKIEALGITNNFNTDFAVPPGINFTSYEATMRVENEAEYDVTINLKYANDAVSTALEKKKVPMTIGQNYSLPFKSSVEQQPYQINFNIAGPNNNTYTISVMACQ